jgi:hypothetical protein
MAIKSRCSKRVSHNVIEALGLDSKKSTPCNTPAETAALGKDVDGKQASDRDASLSGT